MRNKDEDVEKVETPQEFIDLFSEQMWEYNYIETEVHEMLVGWLEDYIKLRNTFKAKLDKNNKPMRGGDIIKFKWNNEIELIGDLEYNVNEMRFEVNIINNPEYVCLFYDIMKMSDVEIIGNKNEKGEVK